MNWRKLGVVFAPDGSASWAHSHAMIPTPLSLPNGLLRIFYSCADASIMSRVGYLDVRPTQPANPVSKTERPVLDIGRPGAFDEHGVNACSVLEVDGQVWMYYVGYQRHEDKPYTLFTGLARSETPDGPFERMQDTPILTATEQETTFRTAPFVIRDSGKFRMWYIGGSDWIDSGGKLLPVYSLRHLWSENGIEWIGESIECLRPDMKEEIGFGRPYVIKRNGAYHMWYSIRSTDGYVLGYAESDDGIAWQRMDSRVGIGRSAAGWDSEMICYAAVVPSKDRYLMFYNGNGYGRSGLGLAESRLH